MNRLIINIAAAVIVTVAAGCTRRLYVPVEQWSERVCVDTVYLSVATRDSIYERDSIYVAGPVITRDRLRYRYVTVHDTLERMRHDTVVVTRTVTVTEPSPAGGIGPIDNMCLRVGRLSILALIIFLIVKFLKYRCNVFSLQF